MTPAPIHERMVSRLIADVRPIRPLWATHVRLGLWLTLQVVTLASAVAFGLRADLGAHLRQPPFVLELGLWLGAGAVAAAVALRAAVPGTRTGPLEVAFWLLLGATAAVLATVDAGEPAAAGWRFVTSGLQCVLSIAAFAAIPWLALFVAVRRGAPLGGPTAGLYAGAAALLFAAAAVRIACPIDAKAHLLAWHATSVVIGAALSVAAGARWLERERA